jgi:hypothetical protein
MSHAGAASLSYPSIRCADLPADVPVWIISDHIELFFRVECSSESLQTARTPVSYCRERYEHADFETIAKNLTLQTSRERSEIPGRGPHAGSASPMPKPTAEESGCWPVFSIDQLNTALAGQSAQAVVAAVTRRVEDRPQRRMRFQRSD